MKKLFLSTLLLALSFGVSAQSFSWGAKVNVGSPNPMYQGDGVGASMR